MFQDTTVAVATPPSGILSGTVFARASFVNPTDIKFKIKGANGQEVIRVNNAQEVVVQQIIVSPDGQTGWHSHPGPVVVLVTAGQLSFYDGEDPTCTARIYSAGQAFVDSGQGHVHIARTKEAQILSYGRPTSTCPWAALSGLMLLIQEVVSPTSID